MATQLTKNFTLEELYASNTAKANKIDNTPTPKIAAELTRLAVEVLQPIRDAYGKPIGVNCAYRCPKVNALVGGSKTSQHLCGQAADIRATKSTNKELFKVIYDLIQKGTIKVGQLIWEFGSDKEPGWIHVSTSYSKTNQIIQAKKIGGTTKYVPFNPDLLK